MPNNNNNHKVMSESMRKNLVRGAAGVAIAAGVVAAGVALTNKRARDKMGKGLHRGFKTVGEIAEAQYGTKGGTASKTKRSSSKTNRGTNKMNGKANTSSTTSHKLSLGKKSKNTGRKSSKPNMNHDQTMPT
jgi:hypothetical protein